MPTYHNLGITEQLLDDLRYRDDSFTAVPTVHPAGILRRRPHDNDIQRSNTMSSAIPTPWYDRQLQRSKSYHRSRPERRSTRFVDDIIEERTRRGPEIVIPISSRNQSPPRKRESPEFRYNRSSGIFVADISPKREERRYAIEVPPQVHQELRRSDRDSGVRWKPFIVERQPKEERRENRTIYRHSRHERIPESDRGVVREEIVRKTYLDEWGRPFTVEKRKLV